MKRWTPWTRRRLMEEQHYLGKAMRHDHNRNGKPKAQCLFDAEMLLMTIPLTESRPDLVQIQRFITQAWDMA